MSEQLLKTSGADVFSSGKKIQKNLKGDGPTPPPPHSIVRPRVKSLQDDSLFDDIKFLLLRKYASPLSFCYRWSLICLNVLLAIETFRKNEWKLRSKSGTNLEKCHICQLIYWPRDLPASFSLNILLRIYIFAAYLFRANLWKSILSSSVVQCQNSNFSPFKQLSQFMNYL